MDAIEALHFMQEPIKFRVKTVLLFRDRQLDGVRSVKIRRRLRRSHPDVSGVLRSVHIHR